MGRIQNPEEYLNVIETGQLDPLVEADRAQLDLVRSENESLMDGQPVPGALLTDNHVLHIREHSAQLNSSEVRFEQAIAQNVLAHVMEHLQHIMQPHVMQLQAILGFQLPPLGAGPPPGAPTGSSPGGPPPGGGRAPSNGSLTPPQPGAVKVQPPKPPQPPRVPQANV